MPRMNHVNLGVPVGGKLAMIGYLVDVLGLRPTAMSDAMAQRGASWFEGDDGVQVHLSEDPDHRPAARAHVALDFGGELEAIAQRLREVGVEYEVGANPEVEVILCADPAGNRWELRGNASAQPSPQGRPGGDARRANVPARE